MRADRPLKPPSADSVRDDAAIGFMVLVVVVGIGAVAVIGLATIVFDITVAIMGGECG